MPALDRLNKYLKSGMAVHGWLDSYSAVFIGDLSKIQREYGIIGGIGEIGVHMGRLFILLKLTALPTEKCFAIDVFGDQHLNIDKSGFGDRSVFLRNVRKWCGDDNVTIIQAQSADVEPAEITDTVGLCRLVSIDGGHTEECVYGDLQLIEGILVESGVVILDDFFNESWPGVATGASKYFLELESKLRPFAITPNKMYLSAPKYHEFYRNAARKIYSQHFEKTVRLFSNDVDIFGCELNKRPPRNWMHNAIRESAIWRFARSVKNLIT
jgi:hypothetical protein